MTRIVVLRDRWLNGSNTGNRKTYLYHPKSRHMDILGFYLAGLGVKKGDLYLRSGVTDAIELARGVGVTWLGSKKKASPIAQLITTINNTTDIPDAFRELILTDAFSTVGVQVEFVG